VKGNVVLSKILADKVIIKNKGNYESLLLYENSQTMGQAAVSQPAKSAAFARSAITGKRRNKAAVAQKPKQPALTSILTFSMQRDRNGVLQGYKVKQKSAKVTLPSLGLQPDDLITAVDELSVLEQSHASELFKLMRTAQKANLAVLREGKKMTIQISVEPVNNSA
jgi:type II secretion system protein C